MDDKENKIYKYWNSRAKNISSIKIVTVSDFNLREIESEIITPYFKKNDKILEVGCGAGYTTGTYSKYINFITAIDFSESMIERAKKYALENKVDNAEFLCKSILDSDFKDNSFDKVLSIRCLINLTSWEKQKQAIMNIHRVLKKGGLFLVCESTLQGLENLNKMRRKANLKDCPIVWHNQPFDKNRLLDFIKPYFEIVKERNFGLYYFISRIIHPLLVNPEEPKWEHKINKIAKDLSLKFDMYPEISYESFFVLRKK